MQALGWNASIAAIAHRHSQEMAAGNILSHHNQRGQGPAGRGVAAGLSCPRGGLGENIWKGSTHRSTVALPDDEIASEAVVDWVNSPEHQEDIFAHEYTESGVGVAITDEGEVYGNAELRTDDAR